MSGPLRLEFVRSAAAAAQLPDRGPEVAVVGRSNVGKSSLINALAGRRNLARVSQTPGRTQLLNCYALPGRGALIDCPGFGFAKAPAQVRAEIATMVDDYLRDREVLRLVLLLVDGAVGPTRLDHNALAGLALHRLPFRVVATKSDKVKPSERGRRRRDLAAGCDVAADDVLWVSATTGAGIEPLREVIRAEVREPA